MGTEEKTKKSVTKLVKNMFFSIWYGYKIRLISFLCELERHSYHRLNAQNFLPQNLQQKFTNFLLNFYA